MRSTICRGFKATAQTMFQSAVKTPPRQGLLDVEPRRIRSSRIGREMLELYEEHYMSGFHGNCSNNVKACCENPATTGFVGRGTSTHKVFAIRLRDARPL